MAKSRKENKSVVVSIKKIYLTLDEAMKLTGWSKDYFKTLRRDGVLNFSKPHGSKMVMYRVDDIVNLIENNMQWKHGVRAAKLMDPRTHIQP